MKPRNRFTLQLIFGGGGVIGIRSARSKSCGRKCGAAAIFPFCHPVLPCCPATLGLSTPWRWRVHLAAKPYRRKRPLMLSSALTLWNGTPPCRWCPRPSPYIIRGLPAVPKSRPPIPMGRRRDALLLRADWHREDPHHLQPGAGRGGHHPTGVASCPSPPQKLSCHALEYFRVHSAGQLVSLGNWPSYRRPPRSGGSVARCQPVRSASCLSCGCISDFWGKVHIDSF